MADKTVHLEFSLMGRTIFSSSYVPDANNEIHFRDLCSIIETYLVEEPLQRFHYLVWATSEQMIIKDFDVLLCHHEVADSGAKFVQFNFLTSLMKRKVTGLESTEFLYFTNPTTTSAFVDPITVDCLYFTSDNRVVEETRTLAHTGVTGINRIDVSPRLFNDKPDMTLASYTVKAGERFMYYDAKSQYAAASIRFKNNFGCVETYTFRGTIEIKPEIKRSAALVNGRRVNYSIRQQVRYKCHAFIVEDMFYFALDICTSDDVAFVVGDNLYPVAVVDSDMNVTNSFSSYDSFWVEFVAADKRGFRLPELTGIFDDTFDNTYN